MRPRTDIRNLIGEKLSAVSFVMDYLEFHFNGPVLRTLTHPVLATGEARVAFEDPGYRDALCLLIGQTVRDLGVKDGHVIEVVFDSGQILRVPLDEKSKASPEAAHYVPEPDAPIVVW